MLIGLAIFSNGRLVLARARTLPRHRNIPSLQVSPVVSGRSMGPAPPKPGWMPNFSVSSQKRLKSWVWSGLHQRSPLAAVWMSGFCRGAVRPLSNDHRRSSLKFTTSSRDLGAPLTLPASVLPLHPPSLRLTALKKRDMRGCLNWMSQWLHISAHPLPSAGRRRPVTRPSHAGPLQRSLDAPTLQLDRRLRRSTLWWFSRSIRPSSSLP